MIRVTGPDLGSMFFRRVMEEVQPELDTARETLNQSRRWCPMLPASAAMLKEIGGDWCPDCRNVIDTETCWCGDDENGSEHTAFNYTHSLVPMGCNCLRHRSETSR